MNETPLLSLTDRAIARLRTLGDGNGVDPEAFNIVEKTEEIITVKGVLKLTPDISVQSRAIAGKAMKSGVKGKEKIILPGFAALHEEAERQRKAFMESGDWLPEAIKELKEEPGYGWGHDGGKIVFPGRSVTLAATEKCPSCLGKGQRVCEQCQGQGQVICSYCFGNKQEPCYHCFGKGVDPAYPGQTCTICRGTRFAPCRYCKATGFLPCPSCQGRGGVPCPDCKGKGFITQEVEISAGASIGFSILNSSELPSGLLRSLDRIGMANLAKGHADIEIVEPEDHAEAARRGIILVARIPYADIKLRMQGKLVIAASFGKHGLLSGIPPFLDNSLKKQREQLALAAAGKGQLAPALGARAMREALALSLRGKGQLKELRRLYPVGLSQKAAQEILDNFARALRLQTARVRLYTAAASVILSAGVFSGFFLTPLRAFLEKAAGRQGVLAVEILLPISAIGLAGFALSRASKWALQRLYPKSDVKTGQDLGKTGYVSIALIVLVYALVLAFSKYYSGI